MQSLSHMAVHRQTCLASVALYQQALRTAERVKTLMRQIDDISREVHRHLDDLDVIIKEIHGTKHHLPYALENASRCAVSVRANRPECRHFRSRPSKE
jgi:hypothetical protein